MSASVSDSLRRVGRYNADDGLRAARREPPSSPRDAEILERTLAADAAGSGQRTCELEEAVVAPRSQIQLEEGYADLRSKLRIPTAMTALFATLFVAALNQTIVATAIPNIVAQLHSASGYAWIGGAYLLANAAAAPVWAKLSDIWGRKPILLAAVGMYFMTSIICALSTSMKMLIIGRACQGTAGGGLIQLVNITISDLFSMRKRSLHLGLLELIWAIAGGIGPVLGGVFTQYISWRWIFWINLPISGTAFILLLFFLDVHNPRTPLLVGVKAMDWFGCISMLSLMVMLLLGLDFGGTAFPWSSPTVIGLIVAGLATTIFFIWSENSLAKYPLMPLGIFRDKSNVACLLIGFFHDFVYVATEYYLPLFFQSVLLSNPLRSGVFLLPIVLTEAFTGIVCGLFIHGTGRYLELTYIGTLLLLIGSSLYTRLSATSSVPSIIGFEIAAGVGTGLLFTPPLLALQAHVKQEQTATETSTMGFVRNLATCLSVVVGGVVFQNGMGSRSQDLRDAGLSSNLTAKLTGDMAAANVILIGTIEDPKLQLAVKQAFAGSLRGIWIICAVMAGCALLCGGFVRRRVLSDVHVETRTGVGGQDNATVRSADG